MTEKYFPSQKAIVEAADLTVKWEPTISNGNGISLLKRDLGKGRHGLIGYGDLKDGSRGFIIKPVSHSKIELDREPTLDELVLFTQAATYKFPDSEYTKEIQRALVARLEEMLSLARTLQS